MPDMSTHLGTWKGTWETFLEPNAPYDVSPVRATITQEGDEFLIDYNGSIQGEDVAGRMSWSESGGTTVVDWVDSWHTGGEHQQLEGRDGAPPSYQYNDEEDPWTWDITVETTDSGITVAHHNAGPGIPRYLGVLMKLEVRS